MINVQVAPDVAREARALSESTGLPLCRIVEQGIKLRLAEMRAGKLLSGAEVSA